MSWSNLCHRWPAVVVLMCVWTGGCSRSSDTQHGKTPGNLKKHNVLLVTLDTTRADYLSCYDSLKGVVTPNLDALAEDGVRFEFAIAQSAGTPMSHASILTGLNPYQHGVRVISAASGYRLSKNVDTLTTALKELDWRTGAFLSAFTVSEYYGFEHGFDHFDNGLKQEARTIVEDIDGGHRRWDQRKHQRRSDATIDRALEWLAKTVSAPFFMWVHLWDPHDRMMLPPKEFLAKYIKQGMSEEDYKRAVYLAEVAYMDVQMGRLLAALRESGQYDDTIIVVVGDHGQGLGQHDWWSHRLLYQEDLHVPLIVRVPGWPVGKVVKELVRTVDIYPTIREGLELETPQQIAGISMRGLIAGEPEAPRLAYADQINKYDLVSKSIAQQRPKDDLLFCAMDRQWKLIYRYTYPNESELYNLVEDPHELNNLFGRHPEQERRLKELLDDCNGYVTSPFRGVMGPDDATMKALSSLGYVGGDEEDEDEVTKTPTSRPTSQPTSSPE